jgi:hypothetical protein
MVSKCNNSAMEVPNCGMRRGLEQQTRYFEEEF